MGSLDYNIQGGPIMAFPGELRDSMKHELETCKINIHFLKTYCVSPTFFSFLLYLQVKVQFTNSQLHFSSKANIFMESF